MSDNEILKAMLGNFPENSFERQEIGRTNEVDLKQRRPHRDTN